MIVGYADVIRCSRDEQVLNGKIAFDGKGYYLNWIDSGRIK